MAEEHDSDIDVQDPNNFKGIYFGDKTEKFTDPATGAHFEFTDLCQRLIALKKFRKQIDKRLGIAHSSDMDIVDKQAKSDGSETTNDNQSSTKIVSQKQKRQ